MLTPDAYAPLLSPAQLEALMQADARLLPIAEATARAEVAATLSSRYDVAPLLADATGASWPTQLRQAVAELALATLAARQPLGSAAAQRAERAASVRHWLARAAAGHTPCGLAPRPAPDPEAPPAPTAPLLGGSHPRQPHGW